MAPSGGLGMSTIPPLSRDNQTSDEQAINDANDPRRPSHYPHSPCWNVIGAGIAGSLRLDAGELHHLAPLLGFLGDELAEVGGRAWKCGGIQPGKPHLHLRIGEDGIDPLVEFLDRFYGRVARCADAVQKLAS